MAGMYIFPEKEKCGPLIKAQPKQGRMLSFLLQ